MTKKVILSICFVLTMFKTFSQNRESYAFALNEIHKMLTGEAKMDFKKAVFLTENAFYSNSLNYKEFWQELDIIKNRINQFMSDKGVANHVMGKQFAIFHYMMEPSPYNDSTRFIYDFEDLTGDNDWTKMFVTKLLRTKSGNCHSLPYLYKILAEELGAEVYLALGPNHLYIKHKDDKGQWVNVELTNGTFPRDGWMISSLSISTEAIKNEVYMEPMSLQESVALTLVDLALGYQFQFGHDDFMLKCCDTLLEYYPKCINAYMVKREVLAEKRNRLVINNVQQKESGFQLEKMISELNKKIENLGYSDMPVEQYQQWVKDAERERQKQLHTEVNPMKSTRN
jgi:hypothetical protein